MMAGLSGGRKPPPLRSGDRIGIVAPAGPVDPEPLEAGINVIRRYGFEVIPAPHLYKRTGFFAGTDRERAADLLAMLEDPSIHAVLCARGGYGSQRLLPLLSGAIPTMAPKLFVGYSDITALHALLQRSGWITWHGPMPGEWSRLRDGGASVDALFAALTGRFGSEGEVPVTQFQGLKTLLDGLARGRLVGGNLSVVAALLGSEYEVQTEGAILFLEEVGEAPYRIDRMLSSLELAGKLQKVNGVLLGAFTGCEPAPGSPNVSAEQVLRSYFLPRGIPVLAGYPAGHGSWNMPLPLGCRVELDATNRRLRLLEPPVQIGS